MFALSVCPGSGSSPEMVPAPSSGSACTGSSPWKLPAAGVNSIGAANRLQWKLFTKKKTCVPFCARFVVHDGMRGLVGVARGQPCGNALIHEHGNSAVQSEFVVSVNVVNG